LAWPLRPSQTFKDAPSRVFCRALSPPGTATTLPALNDIFRVSQEDQEAHLRSQPPERRPVHPATIKKLLFIWTSHIIVLFLYRHRALSLNHIQYHTHQHTQIYYTHNILSQFSNICGIGNKKTGKGIKQILLEPIS
jgi:hypothetical protein